MVTYKKVFDPGETSRRLNLIVRLPETLAGLSETPYRQEAVLIDHILSQWMLAQIGEKTIEQAIEDGSLHDSIVQALNLAKKGRKPAAVNHVPEKKLTKPRSHVSPPLAPPLSSKTEQASTAPVSKPDIPVTETAETTQVTRPVTAPVIGERKKDTTTTEDANSKEVLEITKTTEMNVELESSEKKEEPDSPPPGIASKLSSMFD